MGDWGRIEVGLSALRRTIFHSPAGCLLRRKRTPGGTVATKVAPTQCVVCVDFVCDRMEDAAKWKEEQHGRLIQVLLFTI